MSARRKGSLGYKQGNLQGKSRFRLSFGPEQRISALNSAACGQNSLLGENREFFAANREFLTLNREVVHQSTDRGARLWPVLPPATVRIDIALRVHEHQAARH
jgi:hypothetical protein